MAVSWALRPAQAGDAQWMAELRALVMRPDLERLGRWSETRVRTRFLDAYRPEFTWVIVVDSVEAGLIGVAARLDSSTNATVSSSIVKTPSMSLSARRSAFQSDLPGAGHILIR